MNIENEFKSSILFMKDSETQWWDSNSFHRHINTKGQFFSKRTLDRNIAGKKLLPEPTSITAIKDENGKDLLKIVSESLLRQSQKRQITSFILQLKPFIDGFLLCANDLRKARKWIYIPHQKIDDKTIIIAIKKLLKQHNKNVLLWPTCELVEIFRHIESNNKDRIVANVNQIHATSALPAYCPSIKHNVTIKHGSSKISDNRQNKYLNKLESESIHIMREVVSQTRNPVMLYSIGKDSSVMLHLARKAFYPGKPPFPLLHVDTQWKFQEMYQFRDTVPKSYGLKMIVHKNQEGIDKDINPYDHGSALHTEIMKTLSLKQALEMYQFDAAIGGARRDEEKSRAKERIFSFRDVAHQWDPRNQRPELWELYNCRIKPGESMRVFPLSNWTELDIWEYIRQENIPIVPLYFAKERPVVSKENELFVIDDNRAQIEDDQEVVFKTVRFRTLGCYPLTASVESKARNLDEIINELSIASTTERQGRTIDKDDSSSMEKKKVQGYF